VTELPTVSRTEKIRFLLWASGRELCTSPYASWRLLPTDVTMLLAKPSDVVFESICPLSLSCCVLAPVQSNTLLELVSPSHNSSTSQTRHSPLVPLPTVLPMTACLSANPHAILPASKATHFHWNPSVNTQQHSSISDEYYFLGCDTKHPGRNLPTFKDGEENFSETSAISFYITRLHVAHNSNVLIN
jgi:hypothetical protein